MKVHPIILNKIPRFVKLYPKLTYKNELFELEQRFKPVIIDNYRKLLAQNNVLYFVKTFSDVDRNSSENTCDDYNNNFVKWQSLKKKFSFDIQILNDPIDNELFQIAMSGNSKIGNKQKDSSIMKESKETIPLEFLKDENRLMVQNTETLNSIVDVAYNFQSTSIYKIKHFAIKLNSVLGTKFQNQLVASSSRFTKNINYQNLLRLAKDRYETPTVSESVMDKASLENSKMFTKWIENDARIQSLQVFSNWLILTRQTLEKNE